MDLNSNISLYQVKSSDHLVKLSILDDLHPVRVSNGCPNKESEAMDLLKLVAASPIIHDIVNSFGIPISWIQDLVILGMPSKKKSPNGGKLSFLGGWG